MVVPLAASIGNGSHPDQYPAIFHSIMSSEIPHPRAKSRLRIIDGHGDVSSSVDSVNATGTCASGYDRRSYSTHCFRRSTTRLIPTDRKPANRESHQKTGISHDNHGIGSVSLIPWKYPVTAPFASEMTTQSGR